MPIASRSPLLLASGLLLGAAIAVFVASLLIGSSGVAPLEVLRALGGGGDLAARNVLEAVRLPRTLAAFGVGSLLALSGVLLQALFRNPLADPYVMGVSGGAAVGAVLGLLLGASAGVVQLASLAAAFATVALVWGFARGGGTARLLLTGVVFASACGAIVSVLLSIADSERVRGMLFWLAGDLGWALDPGISIAVAALAAGLTVLLARPLNVLAAGELRARSVGLDLTAWRAVIFVACAVLTSLATLSAGTIGFVGLVTPHAMRLLFRTTNHRVVAPAAALCGGTLLAAADLLARAAFSPRQIPVGAVMALIGSPVFLVLLRRSSPLK